jgi:hypothetical protein
MDPIRSNMCINDGKQEDIDTFNYLGYSVPYGRENTLNVKLIMFPNL